MCYIQGTLDYSLTYSPDPTYPELFTTYSDVDHGGCKDSGHSTGGYLVKMGSSAVPWCSKLQTVVTLSTTKAEYMAAVQASKEIKWMQSLLSKIGLSSSTPSSLLIDNQ